MKRLPPDNQDQQRRRKAASDLDEVLAYLRVGARTDYYTGYSLTDTVREQAQRIGKDKSLDQYTALELRTTKLGRLAVFEDRVASAIAAAEEIE